MRRILASTLLIACAMLATGCGLIEEVTAKSQPELGRLETFKGKGFQIKLPCIPAKSDQKVPVAGAKPLTMQTWMCDGGDVAYGVSAMRFTPDIQANLDGAAQGAADAIDGKVVSNKKVTYAGSPARDVRIESTYAGKAAVGFQRIIVRNRTMYAVQVFVIGDATSKAPPLYGKVLKSLKFR